MAQGGSVFITGRKNNHCRSGQWQGARNHALPQDADKKLAEETALADENVQRAIDGDIRKLIVVATAL